MYGILTDDEAVARRGVGDFVYYLAERVSGRRHEPVGDAINTVACWGDTAAVEADPTRAAVTADGVRAVPEEAGHHWGTVCPTDPGYRSALLDRIEEAGETEGVRLSTHGFPGPGFCRCDRCERVFSSSDHESRTTWRSDVVTAFVEDAAERVEGDLVASLYPDPYPGNLRERTGLDPQALAPHVDGFYVPMCSAAGYETAYWVESLARGFARELDGLGVPLTIHLSAAGANSERLAGVARRIEDHVDAIVFATHRCDVDVATEAIRRLKPSSPAARRP